MTNAELFYLIVTILCDIDFAITMTDRHKKPVPHVIHFFIAIAGAFGTIVYGAWGIIILTEWLNSFPPLLQ